jgi:nucleoside 2-deoxyribosyltransferase
MIKNLCRVYLAMKLTGLKADEVCKKSLAAKMLCWNYGLQGVSPWDHQHVKNKKIIRASPGKLKRMWKKDKSLIESCHVLLDIDGDSFSKGTAMETGFMRYALMRPTVYVDRGYSSVRQFDGDYVSPTIDRACSLIATRWGTQAKRQAWRMKKVYNLRSILRRWRRALGGWR